MKEKQLEFDNLLFEIFYYNVIKTLAKAIIAPFDYSEICKIQPMMEDDSIVYWPDTKELV
jgi:hypothetical protein